MDRHDVIVQALEQGADSSSAAERLGAVLGIDDRAAFAMLAALPATIRVDVEEREAESLLHALREVGFRVRLKKRSASRASMPRAIAHPAPAEGPAPTSDVAASTHSASPPPRAHCEIDLGEALPLPELPVPEPIARSARSGSAPPRAVSVPAAPASAQPPDEDLTPPRFWGALPGALVFPFRGPGRKFLLAGSCARR